MQHAEFGEREYETAANAELALSGASCFTPDQVLEGILGFDAATFPPNAARIWSILRTAAPPGTPLLPTLLGRWKRVPAYRFPSRLVSLVFQYKRPKLQDHARAKHFAFWRGPYYEFEIRKRQHAILQDLEARVAQHAAVRYAAPAFWQSHELYHWQDNGQVLDQSAYISPAAIRKKHRRWTYQSPGTIGRANPEPEETPCENWDSLVAVLTETAVETTLEAHVEVLAAALETGVSDDYHGFSYLHERLLQHRARIDRDKVAGILKLLRVATWCYEHDLTWFVVLITPGEWHQRLRHTPGPFWHPWFW